MRDLIALIRGHMFIFKCRMFKKNVSIKKGLMIYKKLTIEGVGCVEIGENFKVCGIKGDKCQYVTIDTYSKDAIISIGNNVTLYASRISSNYKISIGDNVQIEESGVVDTDFHSIEVDRGCPRHEDPEKCQISIGSNVSIGAQSLVLKGVAIEDDAIIIPGSVASLPIKSGIIAGGNPARKMKF